MMQYETPEMEKIAFEVKETVANDAEIELDFGDMISKNSQPQA